MNNNIDLISNDLISNAPPIDRLGAALFDLLIVLLPLVMLAIAPLRAILIESLLLGEDLKVTISILLISLTLFLVFFAYQFFCYYLFQSTFGQRVFGLKIVSLTGEPHQLEMTQAALRALCWPVGVILLVPLFAAFGHPHRRLWHDRVSDTKILSFKSNARELGPFGRGFYRGAIAGYWILSLSSLGLTVAFTSSYLNDEKVLTGFLEQSGDLCSEVGRALREWSGSSEVAFGVERLDVALSLYLADNIDQDCLRKEVDHVSQVLRFEDARLYFAKHTLAESESDKKLYSKQLCKVSAESDLCLILNSSALNLEELQKPEAWSWPALILLLDQAKKERNHQFIVKLTEQVIAPKPLGPLFARMRAQALWYGARTEEARGHWISSLSLMSQQGRKKLTAWACQEELDLDCKATNSTVCKTLRHQMTEESRRLTDTNESLALLTINFCEDPTESEWQSLQASLQQPRLRSYAKALRLVMNGEFEKARDQVAELLPRAKGQFRFLLNKLLLTAQPDPKELEIFVSSWQQQEVDQVWFKNGRLIFDHLFEKGQFVKATEVGQMIVQSFVDNRSFAQNLVLAAYHSGLKPLAWERLISYRKRFSNEAAAPERMPAGESEFFIVSKVLDQEFGQ